MPDTQLTSQSFDFERLFVVPQGADLPSDGLSNDRTDAALESRARSYRQADDLNWLLQSPGVRRAPQSMSEGSGPPPPAENVSRGLRGLASAAAMDLGLGAVETPRQIVGGMRDAVQSIIDLEEDVVGLSGWLERSFPSGGIRIGSGGIEYLLPDELASAKRAGASELPTIGGPRTVTGGAVRGITQFMRHGR